LFSSQDPQKLEKYDMSTFYHIKQKIKLVDEEDEEARKSATYTLNSTRSVPDLMYFIQCIHCTHCIHTVYTVFYTL
jgi:succinate dehydrogenase/fumarate reductase-like Fe-S protein